MTIKSKKVNDVKKYLFDLWETTHFVKINNTVFNTDNTTLTYNFDTHVFEIFKSTDITFEKAILSVKKEDIITINNQTIILDDDIKSIIDSNWKTSAYMKINGFLFSMSECYNLFISNELIIYNEGGCNEVTRINIEDINSLIIDEKKVL